MGQNAFSFLPFSLYVLEVCYQSYTRIENKVLPGWVKTETYSCMRVHEYIKSHMNTQNTWRTTHIAIHNTADSKRTTWACADAAQLHNHSPDYLIHFDKLMCSVPCRPELQHNAPFPTRYIPLSKCKKLCKTQQRLSAGEFKGAIYT